MTNAAATDQINRDLHNEIDSMRSNLDRVELLAAALNVLSRPVLDYEPRFHHVHRIPAGAHELGKAPVRKQ
jgi:hypothetical protein